MPSDAQREKSRRDAAAYRQRHGRTWQRADGLCSRCEVAPVAGPSTSWCRACNAESKRALRAKSAESRARMAESSRRSWLRRKYGISVAEYDALLAAQDGGCAVCGSTCASGNRLAVDHDHATGANRGLLCRACNGLVGSIESGRVAAALKYLDAHR